MLVNFSCRQRTFARLATAVTAWIALHSLAGAAAVPDGFASLNGGTTGGAGGATVTATTGAQFIGYATQSGPLTIHVVGSLDIGGLKVASDKTIVGVGASAALTGSLQLSNVSNIIVRNLSISNPFDDGEDDAITLRESTNVWFDHNNIFDSGDGLLDIVAESDFVTVSWNKFYYTDDYAENVNTGHRYAMLIGNGDDRPEDADNLRVTIHHNHWGAWVDQRMPRTRYGDMHVYNNYYNSPGNTYGVGAGNQSEVLVENNSFEEVNNPYIEFVNSAGTGALEASGNLLVDTTGYVDGDDDVFDPPYSYWLDDAADVKGKLLDHAGVLNLFGDFNHDDMADGADFLDWQTGDSFNHLSPIDLCDWQDNFGMSAPLQTANGLAAPEPGAGALGAIAILGIVRMSRRRRRVGA